MKLLVSREMRILFYKITVVLVLLLFAGVALTQVCVNDSKTMLLTRDAGIAGYLLEHGIDPSDVASALSAEKSDAELSAGKKLLDSLGRRADTPNLFLPEVNALQWKYVILVSISAVILAFLLYILLCRFFLKRDKTVERAGQCIASFLAGDSSVRIDSGGEGELYQFFASVNEMAASLNSHIENERQTKEFLKDMISDISHQLKTPLAALKMYNEIIQDESTAGQTVKEFACKTDTALNRMETLIQNLLKITRMDAGVITFHKIEISISSLMQGVLSDFDTRAQKERKTITLSGSDDVMLCCDKDWMAQAIGNLVKNALDHTDEGGNIEVTWKETPVVIQITVKDNGKGIHSEDIHSIFKRFYRSRFSQDTQGAGLGLPLTKSIVEAHNGSVSVESKLGQGSSFALDFLKLTEL